MSSQNCEPIRPTVLWAQREDKIYFTIEVWDVCEEKCSFTSNSISFSGRNGDTKQCYAFDLEFYESIKTTPISKTVSGRSIFLVLEKEECSTWPRLTKSSNKLSFVKTDFGKWIDPDKDDESSSMLSDGFDFSKFSNFNDDMGPGMDAFGGDMNEDSEFEVEEPLDQEIKKQLAKDKQEA